MKTLAAGKADEINKLHESFRDGLRATLQIAIRIGELLAEKKEECGHGNWLPWIKANLSFDDSTARIYMRIFRKRADLLNRDSSPILTLHDAARISAKPDKEELEEKARERMDKPKKAEDEQDEARLAREKSIPVSVEEREMTSKQLAVVVAEQEKTPKQLVLTTTQKETPRKISYIVESVPKPSWTDSQLARKKLVEAGQSVLANEANDQVLIAWAESVGKLVRIDRPSDWGNPYLVDEDGTRDEVLKWFKEYYRYKRSLHKRQHELDGKVLTCCDSPGKCHGNHYLELQKNSVAT